jgi:uncharacterized membrane protein
LTDATLAHAANDSHSAARRKAVPIIDHITFADVRWALGQGLNDLRRAPACGLVIGAFYALGGVALYMLATWAGLFYLTYPLAAGFVLLGPFFAIAIYEVSRRLEAGEPRSLRKVAGVVTGSGGHSLGWMPMLNLFAFFIWVDVAAAIYLGFFGLRRFDLVSLFTEALTTTHGLIFLVVGNAIGAVFAVLVFSTTVVSYPVLLDRDTDFITAIATSWKVVRTNPVPMLGFGFIVGVLMFLAILPGLLGLIVVLPILGHATWHLYRRVVSWPPDSAA